MAELSKEQFDALLAERPDDIDEGQARDILAKQFADNGINVAQKYQYEIEAEAKESQSLINQAIQSFENFGNQFNKRMQERSTFDPIASGFVTASNLGKLGRAAARKVGDVVFPKTDLVGPDGKIREDFDSPNPAEQIGLMLPQTPTQAVVAAPQGLGALGNTAFRGMTRVPGQVTPEIHEALRLGQPTTAAEATGSKFLGKLESVLRGFGGGRNIDEVKAARAEMQRIRAEQATFKNMQVQLEHDLEQLRALHANANMDAKLTTGKAISELETKIAQVRANADDLVAEELRLSALKQEKFAGAAKRARETQKGMQLSQEGKEAVQSKFTPGYTDREYQIQAMRELADNSRAAKGKVNDLYDNAKALMDDGVSTADEVIDTSERNLKELKELLVDIPENRRTASTLRKVLDKLHIDVEYGLQPGSGLPAGERIRKGVSAKDLLDARRDLNHLLAKEGYKGTNLEGVSGGYSNRGRVLQELADSVDASLQKRLTPEAQKALSNADSEFAKFANEFRNKGVRALKTKDPQQILDFVTATDQNWKDVSTALGKEGTKKLREANYKRLFNDIMGSDNPEAVLRKHLDDLSRNDEVLNGLHDPKDLEDLQKLVTGRATTSEKYLEKTGKIIQGRKELEQTTAQRLKQIRTQEGREVGALAEKKLELGQQYGKKVKENSKKQGIAEFEAEKKAQEKLAEQNKKIEDTLFKGRREGDNPKDIMLRRGVDREKTIDQILNPATGVALAYGAYTGGGLKGVGLALAAQGIRLTPRMVSKMYTSDLGRKALIGAVEAHGTPKEAEALARLIAYQKTLKAFGTKEDDE